MSPDHFPNEAPRTAGSSQKVAFLGRSNVGKSSLVDQCVPRVEARQKSSSTPGRTRAINFFALHEGTHTAEAQRAAHR